MARSSRTAAVGVLELGLDRLEIISVHAAVQEPQGVLVEALLQEPLFQEEQGLLVLGEDEQAFVVPQLAVHEQILLDPLDQGFGLGVRLAGQGGELGLSSSTAFPPSPRGSRAWLTFFAVLPEHGLGCGTKPRHIGRRRLRGPSFRRRSWSAPRPVLPRRGPCRRASVSASSDSSKCRHHVRAKA